MTFVAHENISGHTAVADHARALRRGVSNSYQFVAAPLSHGSNPNSNMAGRRREDDENLVTAFYPTGGSKDGFWQEQLSPPMKVGTGVGAPAGIGISNHAGVRRLTPTECERLQALPDGHTCGCGGTHEYREILRVLWEAAHTEGATEWQAREAIGLGCEAILRLALLRGQPHGRESESQRSRWEEASAAAFQASGLRGLRNYRRSDRPTSSRRESDEQLGGERGLPLCVLSRQASLAGRLTSDEGGASADHEPRSDYWTHCALPGLAFLCSCPDSRRYAALGDAVTASVSEWIGRRLIAHGL